MEDAPPTRSSRRAAAAARQRQQRTIVGILGVLAGIALVVVAWGAIRLGSAGLAALSARPPGGASDKGTAARSPTAGPGPTAAAKRAPSDSGGPVPSSVINFRTTTRVFTPSTIGNPLGKRAVIPETNVRVSARRAVKSVSIVAIPPAAYGVERTQADGKGAATTEGGLERAATAEASGTGGAEIPVTMVYKGPLKRGVTLLPWTGQTQRGYALPRGIYTLRLTVLADAADRRDVGRSVDTTVELASFVTIGNRDKGLVALTIDDGWNADPRIFELLRDQNVPATAFFIGGRNIGDTNPELIRKAMDTGMEIANHTYDHMRLTGHLDPKVMWDVREGQISLQRISGYNHHWLRPPGGAMNLRIIRDVYRVGFVPVQWSVDTEDTNSRRTAAQRVATTMGAVRAMGSGTIILCHFGGHTTYEVLREIIPQVRAMGLEFGTLSQVMAGTPGFTDEGPSPAMVTEQPAT